VSKKKADVVVEDEVIEEVPEIVEEVQAEEPIAEEPIKEAEVSNEGKLFLRNFFTNDSINPDKVVTKLKGKIFFPKNQNIKPGWYIATVIEEKERYGIMDVIELSDVPENMWTPEIIHGIYIKINTEDSVKEIYRAIPRDRLETEESPCIYRVPFNPVHTHSVNIRDIIESKKKELESTKKTNID